MRITVIGGGAAGFFSSITAAEGTGHQVVLLEASSKLLSKVRVSGGGRCNVTHACFDPAELCEAYPRGGKELRQAFSRFMTGDTVNWFESRGVRLKTEADGRMFPETDDSATIVDCLMEAAMNAGVEIRTGASVLAIDSNQQGFELMMKDGSSLACDRVVVATGGQPRKDGFDWLIRLGHSIQPPVPSLFTFNIPYKPLTDLMGLSVEHAQVSLPECETVTEGPVLVTHWGLSGPAVLKASSLAARRLSQMDYRFQVVVDWLPGQSIEDSLEWIEEGKTDSRALRVRNRVPEGLPRRMWEFLLQESGINDVVNWSDLKKEQSKELARLIHGQRFQVQGKTTFKEEFVTCGGVSLKEVDFKTMQSKLLPGLFFAGEVLDIDAITGGYNFQAAWTTGYLAGRSAASSLMTV